MRSGRASLTARARSAYERAKRAFGVDALAPVEDVMRAFGTAFKTRLGISAERCAVEILEGVRHGRWRIVVGEDAKIIDSIVRTIPSAVYWRPSMGVIAAYALVAIN